RAGGGARGAGTAVVAPEGSAGGVGDEGEVDLAAQDREGTTGAGRAPGPEQVQLLLSDQGPVVELLDLRDHLRLELGPRDHAGVEEEVHPHRGSAEERRVGNARTS